MAPETMKSVANCDILCELQGFVNHQVLERTLRSWETLGPCLFQCLFHLCQATCLETAACERGRGDLLPPPRSLQLRNNGRASLILPPVCGMNHLKHCSEHCIFLHGSMGFLTQYWVGRATLNAPFKPRECSCFVELCGRFVSLCKQWDCVSLVPDVRHYSDLGEPRESVVCLRQL